MLQLQLLGLSGGAWKHPSSAGKPREVAVAKWSLLSVDFGLWEIYRLNLNKLNIKTHFYWPKKKILLQSLTFQSNTWFSVDTKTQSVTRGRVTQTSFTSLLSSKRSPDCRIALSFYLYYMGLEQYVATKWFNDIMCSQCPTGNSPNVVSITKWKWKTKIKSIKIVP